ncbi:MAG: serpin family protein [Deltaproteobacteria bacterium]|jgi:serpin B|nr:serpin family protein [Deltaproteobacteria bacterium]
MRPALLILSSLILLCAARPAAAQDIGDADPSAASPATASSPAAPSAAPPEASAPEVPPAPEAGETAKALASGLNGFAWELYRTLARDGGNVFVSPVSVAEALAMVHAGAAGATQTELGNALGFTFTGKELQGAWRGLRDAMKSAGGEGGAVFRLADSMWPDSSVRLLRGYLDSLEESFGPSSFPVDFSGDPEGARDAINDWTLDVTQGTVSDLIPSPLPPETVLVLVNAVYFKGQWAEAFDRALTVRGDFNAAGPEPKPVKASFMIRQGRYGYLEDDLGQVLEIPYAGGRLSMALLLPNSGDGGLEELEMTTDGEGLASRLDGLAEKSVEVKIPRFRFAWGSKSLKAALGALGVKAAFSDSADLSGMDGTRKLKVSDVVHKAFVDVNEEGTEAAAASGAMVAPTSIQLSPLRFTADRPFLFLIRDKASGAVIFLGRLSDPS